jgi:hypothetical protein
MLQEYRIFTYCLRHPGLLTILNKQAAPSQLGYRAITSYHKLNYYATVFKDPNVLDLESMRGVHPQS